jgi:tetratricopeptide (TPR) repeat protein
LGTAYEALGNYAKAIEYYQQCLDIKRETDNCRGEKATLKSLTKAYLSLGDYAKAVEYSKSWLTIVRKIGDAQEEEVALGILDQALEGTVKLAKN